MARTFYGDFQGSFARFGRINDEAMHRVEMDFLRKVSQAYSSRIKGVDYQGTPIDRLIVF